MVTAKTQYSLNNAQSYFTELPSAGDWFCFGAQSLEFNVKIREADFLALFENESPKSSNCLTQRTNLVREQDGETTANRRILYDFTFSAPKSVSLLALVADDRRIIEAHNRAVQTALAEFYFFAVTRVRKCQADNSRFTRNVIYGLFTHDTSLALDTHLHTHCILEQPSSEKEENSSKV